MQSVGRSRWEPLPADTNTTVAASSNRNLPPAHPSAGGMLSKASTPLPPAPVASLPEYPAYSPADIASDPLSVKGFRVNRSRLQETSGSAGQSRQGVPSHPPQALQGQIVISEEEGRERKRRDHAQKKQEEDQKRRHQQQQQHKAVAEPKADNPLKRPSTLVCRVRFGNELPEPASQPKLVPLGSDPSRYTHYRMTSLEANHLHRMHVEHDLGIPLDLLDIQCYVAPPDYARPPLDPEDEALLADDLPRTQKPVSAGAGSALPARIKERPSDKGLSWLVHTQYISPVDAAGSPAGGGEGGDASGRRKPLSEKEAKLMAMRLEMADEELDGSREGQIRHIKHTFRAAESLPVHPTNPNLQPVEILPILPNIDRLGDQLVHLVFDSDPLADSPCHKELPQDVRLELQSRALLKNFKMPPSEARESGQPFVAYLVPSEASRSEEEEVEYDWVREYLWTVNKSDSDKGTFLLCVHPDHASYVPLAAKLTLSKLKAKEGGRGKQQQQQQREEEDEEQPAKDEFPIPSKITVRKRPFTDAEEDMRESARQRHLEAEDSQVV